MKMHAKICSRKYAMEKIHQIYKYMQKYTAQYMQQYASICINMQMYTRLYAVIFIICWYMQSKKKYANKIDIYVSKICKKKHEERFMHKYAEKCKKIATICFKPTNIDLKKQICRNMQKKSINMQNMWEWKFTCKICSSMHSPRCWWTSLGPWHRLSDSAWGTGPGTVTWFSGTQTHWQPDQGPHAGQHWAAWAWGYPKYMASMAASEPRRQSHPH